MVGNKEIKNRRYDLYLYNIKKYCSGYKWTSLKCKINIFLVTSVE